MRELTFFNNTSFTISTALQSGVPASSATLVDKTGMSTDELFFFTEGRYTPATITHPSMPDAMEVVNVLGYIDGPGQVAIERAVDGTSAQAWPAGAVLECRINASVLAGLSGRDMTPKDGYASAYNGGDIYLDISAEGDKFMIPAGYAIGGLPVAPARGLTDSIGASMAQQVEGVGYTHMLELAVAPDYDDGREYFPGEYARQTQSPFYTFCYGRGNALASPSPLGEAPWVRFDPAGDSNILASPRIGAEMNQSQGTRFYPTEIGFICEEYTATQAPTVRIVEVDFWGDPVADSTLVAATPLAGLAAHTRKVLAGNTLTKGIHGMHFILDSAGAGGTCRGRFYWKGLFVHAAGNDVPGSNGYITEPSGADGTLQQMI